MSKRKNIVLGAILFVILISSFIGWSGLNSALFQNHDYGRTLTASGISFLVWGAVFGILFLVSDSFLWPSLGFILSGLAFLAVFGIKPAYLGGLIFAFLIVYLVAKQAIKDKGSRLKIDVIGMARPPLGAIFTLFSLLTAIVFYFSPPAQDLAINIKIPRPLFNFSMSIAEGILRPQMESKINSEFKKNDPSVLAFLGLDNVVDIKFFTPEIKNSLYESMNRQFSFSLTKYKHYLPYGFAVAAFFALKALSYIFVWIAVGLAQGLLVLMKAFGVVGIAKETVEKEIIEI
ncbi:MAG: hypothetical protein PHQ47_02205 [Candidatus Portnoybacteria bacterium]|nr:hypothetical protein [Candidatus Portnoybacteria bacterium]